MPCDYKKYPDDWKAIRARILERAGHKCEECGVQNYAVGARDRFGEWHDENEIENMKSDCGLHLFCTWPKMTKIVLTTAHIGADYPDGTPGDKHDKLDCRDENLKIMCQRCHLRLDMDEHKANAAQTRLKKKERDQMNLLESADV